MDEGQAGSDDRANGQLAWQLHAIAGHLSVLAAQQGASIVVRDRAKATPGIGGDPGVDRLVAVVEREYRARRTRDAVFGGELFGEPAWDMLLYLFAAQLRGNLVMTSSLVRAAAVPPTTALRWIAQLDQAGLIERCTIKRDGRVRVQRLTRRASAMLEQHFRCQLSLVANGSGGALEADWPDAAPRELPPPLDPPGVPASGAAGDG